MLPSKPMRAKQFDDAMSIPVSTFVTVAVVVSRIAADAVEPS